MKKILLISLLLLSKIAFSQIIDTFSDGDFTKNPTWNGDVTNFQINALQKLQSNGQQIASQTIYLSTQNPYSLNASWEFLVQLNFDPTTTNFVRIYLSSTQSDLKGSLNGYFVQIGETGADDGFHLYKQTGTSTSRIITGAPKARNNANLVLARVKVTRDAAGKWELSTDVSGGSTYQLEGSATDNTFTTSAYMGVFCRYATAARYNQFIFDDFVVDDLLPDLTPPSITKVNTIDAFNIEAMFSEALEPSSTLSVGNYHLSNNYGNPISVVETAQPNVYRLTFAKELLSGNYLLTVNGIKDKKGNVIPADSHSAFTYIKPYLVQPGDVVINEIFANPTGSPSLPQKEFIEVWNTTNEYILTQGWKYADQTSTYTFGVDTIKPNQYLILTARADTALFKPFGKTIGLSPWPSLNNDKDILTLTDPTGKIIDQVAYHDAWYKDEVKKRGGYSLELIDPKNLCKAIQNWSAALDISGGTPGKQNSIYHTQLSAEILKIVSAIVLDSTRVQVEFSKTVDSLSAVQPSHYTINNGLGNPKSVLIQSPQFNTVILEFASEMKRGVEHTLTSSNITDCAGNLISQAANTARLFMAKKIEKNDLLISEVLFNPKAGSVDFVEIYNNSNSVLDIKDLQLANIDVTGKPASIKNVSSKTLLIQPNSYWVISTNSASIMENYFCEKPDQLIQISSMPAYNNDKGTVILLTNNQVIDRFDYTEKMHVALLKNPDGVSLERVSFARDANAQSNFISAAASVGFATPTYKNSQEPNGEENYVKLLNKTFSPDFDGVDDVLQLEYQFTEQATFATVNIYTDKGFLVRILLKNETIGTKGTLTWDGLNEGGQKAAIGIYVVLFDVFNLNGKTKRYKATCVLAGKLN